MEHDLIRRSELLAKKCMVRGYLDTGSPCPSKVKAVPVDVIERAPAVEAEPVRHCQWVLVEKGPERDIYRCPWCGRTIDTIIVESEVARLFPYCHCGTKMDKGEDDG